MATAETKLLTAKEFFEWASRPENQGRLWELDKGEVVEMPPPSELHGIICAWVVHILWEYVLRQRDGKGRVTSNDAGLIVARDPDTVRAPDAMLFGESLRLDQLSRTYPADLPLLVVEVRSPNDSYPRMLRRANQYLARGVAMVWLVDPDERTIAVCQPRENPQILDETEELAGGETLPNFRRQVADFFSLPGQPT